MSVELLQLLLLIIIANGAPILTRKILNNTFDLAVDFAVILPDGKRIFGPSKTWRGTIAAIIATPTAAWLLGYSPETGLLIATYAILGDLTSSFIKRRLAIKPSNMAPLLDQIPESLFPALIMMETFKLNISSVILLVLIFIITDIVLSRTLYILGIRKKPY